MVEPEFDFAARLAELIEEAQDQAIPGRRPLSDDEIIDLLEETIISVQVKSLPSGRSRPR